MLKMGGGFCFPERRGGSSIVDMAGQPHPESWGKRFSAWGGLGWSLGLRGGSGEAAVPTMGPVHSPGPLLPGHSGSLDTHPHLRGPVWVSCLVVSRETMPMSHPPNSCRDSHLGLEGPGPSLPSPPPLLPKSPLCSSPLLPKGSTSARQPLKAGAGQLN